MGTERCHNPEDVIAIHGWESKSAKLAIQQRHDYELMQVEADRFSIKYMSSSTWRKDFELASRDSEEACFN